MADDALVFKRLQFIVPGTPKAWGRVQSRIVRSKKTGQQFVSSYIPKTTRDAEGSVRYFAARGMGDLPPHEGPVQVTMSFLMPIPVSFTIKMKREALNGWRFPIVTPDYDNLAKLICDAMNGVVYRDDKQIVTAFISKRYGEQPSAMVSVKALVVGEPVLGA